LVAVIRLPRRDGWAAGRLSKVGTGDDKPRDSLIGTERSVNNIPVSAPETMTAHRVSDGDHDDFRFCSLVNPQAAE
jgi:hypothetical protein